LLDPIKKYVFWSVTCIQSLVQNPSSHSAFSLSRCWSLLCRDCFPIFPHTLLKKQPVDSFLLVGYSVSVSLLSKYAGAFFCIILMIKTSAGIRSPLLWHCSLVICVQTGTALPILVISNSYSETFVMSWVYKSFEIPSHVRI